MAIALDTSASLGNNTGSSWTVSYTVTGVNNILFIALMEAATNVLTGITYAGVSMTRLETAQTVDTLIMAGLFS